MDKGQYDNNNVPDVVEGLGARVTDLQLAIGLLNKRQETKEKLANVRDSLAVKKTDALKGKERDLKSDLSANRNNIVHYSQILGLKIEVEKL